MPQFTHLTAPTDGAPITRHANALVVPDRPILPFIEGDGIGADIWRASVRVFDAAVQKAYGGTRQVVWFEVLAGEKAFNTVNEWLPADTLTAFREYLVGIKGPLTTPVGGGIRSLNVALRQELDLYTCLRPVRYFNGMETPVKRPDLVDMVIFRENTEDIYAGIEFAEGTPEVAQLKELLKAAFPKPFGKIRFPDSVGLGIKPVSREGTERLVRAAIEYAIANKRKSVTLVHKGNIMKFTEGGFREWGYEVVRDEFADAAVLEADAGGAAGKVVVKDRIADAMFQEVLIRPDQYSVIATSNLNGDYLSDALAAQVGGLGLAPGVNMSDSLAFFEATHGTAPTIAGQDKANPGSLILCGALMLEHMGWNDAATRIYNAINTTIGNRTVTVDLASQMASATTVGTVAFGEMVEKAL